MTAMDAAVAAAVAAAVRQQRRHAVHWPIVHNAAAAVRLLLPPRRASVVLDSRHMQLRRSTMTRSYSDSPDMHLDTLMKLSMRPDSR